MIWACLSRPKPSPSYLQDDICNSDCIVPGSITNGLQNCTDFSINPGKIHRGMKESLLVRTSLVIDVFQSIILTVEYGHTNFHHRLWHQDAQLDGYKAMVAVLWCGLCFLERHQNPSSSKNNPLRLSMCEHHCTSGSFLHGNNP